MNFKQQLSGRLFFVEMRFMKKYLILIWIIMTICIETVSATDRQRLTDVDYMPLRQKVGMIFMIRPESIDPDMPLEQVNDTYRYGVSKVTKQMAKLYRQYPAGGFCIFEKNIVDPKQLYRFTTSLHRLNPNVLLSIDEEGGRITRIGRNDKFDVPHFDYMESLGKDKTAEEIYPIGVEIGRTIGGYLRHYQFDIDFAPVADVNTNPNNIVIGNRAFGSDPDVAASAVRGVIAGLSENGIIGCLKHFPGHGDTTGDTHDGYVRSDKTWEQLAECEMIPFRAGINAGAKMVMTAHIALPCVTGEDRLPSTLSQHILQDKLRGELGFGGVIVSDAICMGAIHNDYTSGEAAVRAFLAGCDMILMPYNYVEAFEAVLAAVQNGDISEERLNASVKRILELKK